MMFGFDPTAAELILWENATEEEMVERVVRSEKSTAELARWVDVLDTIASPRFAQAKAVFRTALGRRLGEAR